MATKGHRGSILRSSAVNLAILAIVPAERAGEDPAAAAEGVERPDDAMLAPEAQHREVGEEQAAAGGDAQQAAQQIGGTKPGAASPPPPIKRRLDVAGAIPASPQPPQPGRARTHGRVA